jgi:hypothetical protein
MTLSELILLIQWEVQKSCNLVDELTKSDDPDENLSSHFGLDKFEITVPISLTDRELYYNEVNKKNSDDRFRKFYYPLIVQSDKDLSEKQDVAKKRGKVLEVAIKSIPDDNSSNLERIGQMTISLTKKFG